MSTALPIPHRPVRRLRARVPERSLWMSIGLAGCTLLLTRHAQLPALGGLLAPWVLTVVFLGLKLQRGIGISMPAILYAGASLAIAFTMGTVGDALRFFVIISGTLLAFFVVPRRLIESLVLAPLALQALIITAISLALAVLQDPGIAAALRAMALDAEWGDIYSFDGYYYRVQVVGNALLPLLFMLCLWRYGDSRGWRVMTFLAGVGLLAGGNVTYLIAAGIALAIRYWHVFRRSGIAKLLALVAVVAITAANWDILTTVVERKFDGSDSSMGVRFDQIDTLADAYADAPLRMVFGAGLGARFPDGSERPYSQFQYIELQLLYLVYQIGIVGMLLYAASLGLLVRRFLSPDGRQIFWLYILSGITNPYILDTNQMVATMLLVCLHPRTRPPGT